MGYYCPTGTDIWIPCASFFFFFFNVVEAELIQRLFERAAHTNHLTFESHTEAPHIPRIVDESVLPHIYYMSFLNSFFFFFNPCA